MADSLVDFGSISRGFGQHLQQLGLYLSWLGDLVGSLGGRYNFVGI